MPPASQFPLPLLTTIPRSSNNVSATTCDPILLQNNATIDYEICPETLVNQVISCIFFGTYVLFVLFTTLGIIKTRNVPLVKNRSVVVMIISLLSNSTLAALYILRMAISRRQFPCFIYMLIQSIGPHIVLGPSFLRLWRMMWLSKLNKARVLKVKMEEDIFKNQTDDNISIGLEDDVKIQDFQMVETGEDSPSIPSSTSMAPLRDRKESNMNVVMTGIKDKRILCIEQDYEKIATLKKRIFIMQKLTSWWFYILFMIFFLFISLLVWMFGGLLETYDIISLRFSRSADFFTFSHGCSNGTGMIILLLVEVVIYLIAIGILLIFTLREDRDTWNLRLEILILSISWFFWVAFYVISGLIPDVPRLTDAYFAYGYNIFFGIFLDNVITVFVPMMRALFYKKPKEGNFSELLDDKKMFEVLMDFAKKSYCVEAPLCYREIRFFQETTNPNKRREMAMNIYENYMRQYAPLELNLPAKFRDEAILRAIKDLTSSIPVTFFDELLTHCENDMIDVITRCCKQDKKMNELVSKIMKPSTNDP